MNSAQASLKVAAARVAEVVKEVEVAGRHHLVLVLETAAFIGGIVSFGQMVSISLIRVLKDIPLICLLP